ncbi:MAG TPA: [FeFe] hydrogenase H-cluster maturation GTPase HydF [Candidatus Gallacutalibacter stercoravium]|nr:[FeFe] hydrogenase H-cluster maturation GTPase HydF [Candidatus Gallacutalibacter stercoravium]
MSLQQTPSANRLHIGLFGKRNSGKSSLVNALTGQNIALVSDVAGTTTDPVQKAMEIHGLGPCLFIDTAGFDDEGNLGRLRVEKTRQALEKTDLALLVFTDEGDEMETGWYRQICAKNIPVVAVLNQVDKLTDPTTTAQRLQEKLEQPVVPVSAATGRGVDKLLAALVRAVPEGFGQESITASLVSPSDIVLLVMPQDIQAPKGRLILPQVQTIRDLLDRRCVVVCATTDRLDEALAGLKEPPKLIITDSQVFAQVYEKKPPQSLLTSFSVLFAKFKGDINAFVQGAAAIDQLTADSRVLIAEACTHAPLQEDIGRVKIPRLLRKRVGESLQVDIVSGTDFPADLSGYQLVIHCGACMFNRKYVLSRIEQAQKQGVPITNYGVAIAKLSGILDKVSY